MMDSFELSQSSRSITWQLPERIDRLVAPFLYEDFENVIWEGTCLVLDLSQTQFIDAVGIDVLKAGFVKCQRHAVQLGVRGMQPPIKAILQAAGFLDAFKPQKRRPQAPYGDRALQPSS